MTTSLTMSKDELMNLARVQMNEHLRAPAWSFQQKVALTCQILFAHGHDSGLAGQITARVGDSGTFITQRLGLGFEEITASNLLVVDENLTVLEGEGMPNPANRFHTWVYRARPDARCIIHTHPLHISALSMLEQPLKISHMDTCLLYDDVAFLKDWPGVPVGNSEGEIISEALGNKRAVFLAHHGLLVAGNSIEEACMLAVQCERAAKMQLLALSAGEIKDIDPALGREAHDWLLQEKKIQANFYYLARRAIKQFPNCLT